MRLNMFSCAANPENSFVIFVSEHDDDYNSIFPYVLSIYYIYTLVSPYIKIIILYLYIHIYIYK